MKKLLSIFAVLVIFLLLPTRQAFAISGNPQIGANYIFLKNDTGHQHDLFGASYNPTEIDKNLQILQENGAKYVRVFDGPVMTARNYLPTNTKNNIIDFLNRANNRGLTVYFQLSYKWEPWALNLYQSQSGQAFKEYDSEFTDIGKAIYAERVKYLVQQVIADRPENFIISIYNEPQFITPSDETTNRNKAVSWTNYMYDQVRSVDMRPNHQITLAMFQGNATPGGWLWWPGDLANFSKLDIIDMHFYHSTTGTWVQEFDQVFGWWAPYTTKPVMISEMGADTRRENEKQAAAGILEVIHHIQSNQVSYNKIGKILLWTAIPYYGLFDVVDSKGNGVPDGPFYRLTDGHQGYTRLGTSVFNDQFLEPVFSSNYPTFANHDLTKIDDYDDSTFSILTHTPTYSEPNEIVIEYGQWYRFHTIRVVDNQYPYPRDFDILISGPTGWSVFKSIRGNTQSVVDATSSQLSGWEAAHAIKIRVYDELENWSTISGIYINPVSKLVQ